MCSELKVLIKMMAWKNCVQSVIVGYFNVCLLRHWKLSYISIQCHIMSEDD